MDTKISTLPTLLPALAGSVLPAVKPVAGIEPRLRFNRRTTRNTLYPVASQVSDQGQRIGRHLDIRV